MYQGPSSQRPFPTQGPPQWTVGSQNPFGIPGGPNPQANPYAGLAPQGSVAPWQMAARPGGAPQQAQAPAPAPAPQPPAAPMLPEMPSPWTGFPGEQAPMLGMPDPWAGAAEGAEGMAAGVTAGMPGAVPLEALMGALQSPYAAGGAPAWNLPPWAENAAGAMPGSSASMQGQMQPADASVSAGMTPPALPGPITVPEAPGLPDWADQGAVQANWAQNVEPLAMIAEGQRQQGMAPIIHGFETGQSQQGLNWAGLYSQLANLFPMLQAQQQGQLMQPLTGMM